MVKRILIFCTIFLAINSVCAASAYNLGITPEQFKAAFNARARSYNVESLLIGSLEITRGTVQDIFEYKISQALILQGSIDKSNGLVRELWFLAQPQTEMDALMTIAAYGGTTAILSPQLTQSQRDDLMYRLKLTAERLPELQNSSGAATVGNVKYTTNLINGVFFLAASAKDL